MLQGHGDDRYNLKYKEVLNFSSNVITSNNRWISDHISSNLDKISHYPEPDSLNLRRAFAKKADIGVDNIIFTNGATEAIYLVAMAFQGSKSCVRIPTFSEYRDSCTIFKHTVIPFEDINLIPDATDLIWICNPNNPTGEILEKDEILNLIDTHINQILVFDLSYKDLTASASLNYQDIISRQNVVGIFSLTKTYGIPGLRIGYIVSNDRIIKKLMGMKMPWSVNALAECAALAIIEKNHPLDITPFLNETKRMLKELGKIGITVYPSKTTFLLCQTPWSDAKTLKQYLLEKHNILIRDASNFEGLKKEHFRIAAKDVKSNNAMINGLAQWGLLFKR